MDERDIERITQLGLVADKGLEWKAKCEALTTERDRLAGEVDRLRADLTQSILFRHAATARAHAAEAHAADLRGALDEIADDGIERSRDPRTLVASAALARTPAQSLGRIKAAALREAAGNLDRQCCDCHDEVALDLRAEADRLEATNG